MITARCVARFGASRPLDAIGAPALRAWLLELRAKLAPESIAGYVRGLKAFGNWCAAEELGSRRIHLSPSTAHPDSAWVTQQARNLALDLDARVSPSASSSATGTRSSAAHSTLSSARRECGSSAPRSGLRTPTPTRNG
jgi:hypothetical protein